MENSENHQKKSPASQKDDRVAKLKEDLDKYKQRYESIKNEIIDAVAESKQLWPIEITKNPENNLNVLLFYERKLNEFLPEKKKWREELIEIDKKIKWILDELDEAEGLRFIPLHLLNEETCLKTLEVKPGKLEFVEREQLSEALNKKALAIAKELAVKYEKNEEQVKDSQVEYPITEKVIEPVKVAKSRKKKYIPPITDYLIMEEVINLDEISEPRKVGNVSNCKKI